MCIGETTPSRDDSQLSSESQIGLTPVRQAHGVNEGTIVGLHWKTSHGQIVTNKLSVPSRVDPEILLGHEDPLLVLLRLDEHIVGTQDNSHGMGSRGGMTRITAGKKI